MLRLSYDFQAGSYSSIHGSWSIRNYECLIHTVGTRSWRKIPVVPIGYPKISFSLLLNGNLHGFLQDYLNSTNMLLYCFGLEAESFKSFPPPPPPLDSASFATLGILDDRLCFVDNSWRVADSCYMGDEGIWGGRILD